MTMSSVVLFPGDLLSTTGNRSPNLWPELNGAMSGQTVPRSSIMVMLALRDNYVFVLIDGQLGYVFRDWVRRVQ